MRDLVTLIDPATEVAGDICADTRTILHREGEPAHGLYEVLEGRVILSRRSPHRGRQIVDIAEAGALIGFSEQGMQLCTAEAATRVRLRPVTAGESAWLVHRLSERIGSLYRKSVALAATGATQRVAYFLVSAAAQIGLRQPEALQDRQIPLQLNRREIADFLALELESVSRAFSELKKRRIITFTDTSAVRVCDAGQLVGLAGA